MYRRIALLHVDPNSSADDLATFERELGAVVGRVPGLTNAHLGRHFPNTVGGGDYTWDLAFAEREQCLPWPDQLRVADHADLFERVVTRADVVQFATTNAHIVEPAITDFVKRTLFIEVDRATPPDKAREFDRVLTGMPRYIHAIRNWAYHRVDDEFTIGPRQWTHVWEQEFQEVSGLRVDYMVSPYHWGYVDPWFDPESPHRVVAPGVAHVYCPAATTILGW
ncbi:MAG: Dabb family protein [Acidimicrobiales bacterium]